MGERLEGVGVGGCALEKVVVEVTNWGRLYRIQAVQGSVDLL